VKALVFLLVLVNLLFYAFSAGYFGRPENPDAGRVEKQVAPERMRIVSRGETPGKGAEAVKAGAAVEVSKAEEAAPVCLVWANLTVADADQLQALLTDKFAEFKVLRTTEAGESNGWWVFIPPLAGKAEADKRRLNCGVSASPIISSSRMGQAALPSRWAFFPAKKVARTAWPS
jgi:hypothetical protein